MKYAIDPCDWGNTFNLALYHFAAGHYEESDTLHNSGLNASQEMTIRDLGDLREWRIENHELGNGSIV